MTTRNIWITGDPFGELTDETIAAATAAGAGEILHGIPPALADRIEAGTLGLVELELDNPPEPDPAPDGHEAALAAATAATAARSAVAGLSPTAATRKAVEALADSLEALASQTP